MASTGTPDRIWVAALSSPASHRGGTLRVAYATDDFGPGFGPYDPAVAPYQDHFQLISMTSDGLVTYRKAGGAAGLQVVPDLAVAMPTISDGGRAYTFQLRKGIRLLEWTQVRASDFRSSVERAALPGRAQHRLPGLLPGVVFSTSSATAPAGRIPDVRPDERHPDRRPHGTITIHLSTAGSGAAPEARDHVRRPRATGGAAGG